MQERKITIHFHKNCLHYLCYLIEQLSVGLFMANFFLKHEGSVSKNESGC